MGHDFDARDDSFVVFLDVHARSLFGTAYLLTGDADRAEELLQDTLAALLGTWWVVSQAGSPAAYARRALTNRFLDSRRGPRGRTHSVGRLPDGAVDDDFAEDVADRELLWQLIGGLPNRQRAAVVLRYFHDLPDEQIAAELGCRPATVRSLLSRALAAMRNNVSHDRGLSRRPEGTP